MPVDLAAVTVAFLCITASVSPAVDPLPTTTLTTVPAQPFLRFARLSPAVYCDEAAMRVPRCGWWLRNVPQAQRTKGAAFQIKFS